MLNSNLRAVRALLSAGADSIKILSRQGLMALVVAASVSNRSIVGSLLTSNADPNAKFSDGHTAGNFAKMSDFDEIARLLESKDGI